MEGMIAGLLLLAGLPALEAFDFSGFGRFEYNYDWKTLKLFGILCAGALCFLGILFVLNILCKCKRKHEQSPVPENAVSLIVPVEKRLPPSYSDSVSTC